MSTATAAPTHPAAGFNAAFWWSIGITGVAALVAVRMPARQRQPA